LSAVRSSTGEKEWRHWVKVKIVRRTPGLADYSDGATGWVSAWALQIGTFRKFGVIGFVFL